MPSIELFTGCGGLALGLSRAGLMPDMMVEWNADAVETVRHNIALNVPLVRDWNIEAADVRTMNWGQFNGNLHLVAGGPPCQPFSVGGKHKGHDDHRDMWPEAIRAVRETHPSAFLFENVRGLTREAFADYLRWITAHLRHPGVVRLNGETHYEHLERLERADVPPVYEVQVLKVNAADYGAPQKRHRVIVAGVRQDLNIDFTPPAPTHSRDRLLWDQWVTGEYWVRHGLPVPDDVAIPRQDVSLVRKLRARNTPPAGAAWLTTRDAIMGLGEPNGVNNHLFQAGARVYPGHTGSPLDQPAKALKAGDHGVPGGENMMVRDDGTVRYFTIREAARLQGLPDEYVFPGSWTESMRQIGNAVPVQLSEAMGNWIAELLDRADGQAVA
ncbi:DNA cytosine methyltransferase [Crenobacter cavernae]|uniref:DNA (cytosine-5-)-methyltransferase n=1 Tax=Crenobacter cavernae TaxID=2290923 RepID=A0A345Y3K7_9NEIS|nr:DNA cytosine methyltransferase [Crenobacter cavernae]AXK38509.1 DNA cytosine methyltransferase [Crenobacter cavernae]